MLKNLILPLYLVAGISLSLYSFTQVDLSLTLSQVSVWQGIQKAFQGIGYFNRPLSAVLYLSVLAFLFILYGLTLRLINNKVIDKSLIMKIILSLSVVLFISYNAFSYDIFNYIFDAKIFTHYNLNPYEYRALDFPEDPMLSFMHWTHRTYPYGPMWLGISIPLSYIGLGYFLLTFYLFKLIALISYVGSAILIGKIASKLGKNESLSLAAFALNPLVIVESLVSAHNDIVMIVLALLATLFYLERKLIKSFISLFASILLKYATVMIIPALMLRGLFKISINMFFIVLILSMGLTVVLASFRTNFQPWYLLYVIFPASFLAGRYYIVIPLFVLSLAALLQYTPYIYLGNWDPPVPDVLNYILYGGIILSSLLVGARFLTRARS